MNESSRKAIPGFTGGKSLYRGTGSYGVATALRESGSGIIAAQENVCLWMGVSYSENSRVCQVDRIKWCRCYSNGICSWRDSGSSC